MNVSYLAAPRRYCSCSRSCMRIDVSKVYKNVVKTTHNIKTRRRVFFRIFKTCRKYFCHVTFSRKFSRSQKILITRSLQRKQKKERKNTKWNVCIRIKWLRYSGNLIIRWNFRKRWRVLLRGNITWIHTSRLNFAAFFIIFLVFSLSLSLSPSLTFHESIISSGILRNTFWNSFSLRLDTPRRFVRGCFMDIDALWFFRLLF